VENTSALITTAARTFHISPVDTSFWASSMRQEKIRYASIFLTCIDIFHLVIKPCTSEAITNIFW
jgi:hypothetical protein